MGRIPKIEPKNETAMVGIHMDKELMDRITQKCEELHCTKREYVHKVITSDLGLKYIPGHYENIE